MTTTSAPPSPPTPMEKHRKVLQAQSIRCLRNHSAASLRSSLDGQELGSEKLKALVEKFKLDVENDDKDSNVSSVDEETATSDSDSSGAEEEEGEEETMPASKATPVVVAAVATNEQVRSKLLSRLGIQSTTVVQQPEANPRRIDIPRLPSFELPLNDAGDFENWESRKLKKQRNPFNFFGQNNNDKNSDDVSNVTDSVDSSVSAGGETKENNETLQETTTTAAAATTATSGDDDKTDTVEDQGTAQPPPKKRVHFHATVKAHSIPSHTVYSKRMKSTIWSSAQELEENVARNCYEFEAENWNFEDVVDEDDMIWYHGQWVHPVHFVDFPSDSTRKTSSKANSEAGQ